MNLAKIKVLVFVFELKLFKKFLTYCISFWYDAYYNHDEVEEFI